MKICFHLPAKQNLLVQIQILWAQRKIEANMNWSVSQTTVRLLGLCVFYLIYLFIGAAVFSAIEYSNERDLIEELKTKRLEFLQRNKKCLNGKYIQCQWFFCWVKSAFWVYPLFIFSSVHQRFRAYPIYKTITKRCRQWRWLERK